MSPKMKREKKIHKVMQWITSKNLISKKFTKEDEEILDNDENYDTQEIQISNGDLYERDSNEILSYSPNAITRWGITVIFMITGVLMLISWLIKFPDIIASRIVILTQTPPAKIVAKTPGKITKLFVKEGEYCKRNKSLALIENTASLKHVLILKKKLNSILHFVMGLKSKSKTSFSHNARLGELQIDYYNFLHHYSNYRTFKKNNPYVSKVRTFKTQILFYQDMKTKQDKQIQIIKNQLDLSEKKYEKILFLYNDQGVSEQELMENKASSLQHEHDLENAKISILNSDITITNYNKDITDLKQEYQKENRELTFLLRDSYKKLQTQIAIWEQKYILKSPINGNVSFFKFWSPYQVVNIGEEVMTIIPKSYKIIGRVLLPQFRSGKVKIGQKIHIKLDSYPFHEYGFLIGKVLSISPISRENKYLIEVSFPNGLTTSYDQKIEFKQEMEGTADIITENLRLTERIFLQIRNIINTATKE